MKIIVIVLLVALGVYLYIRAQRLAREEEGSQAADKPTHDDSATESAAQRQSHPAPEQTSSVVDEVAKPRTSSEPTSSTRDETPKPQQASVVTAEEPAPVADTPSMVSRAQAEPNTGDEAADGIQFSQSDLSELVSKIQQAPSADAYGLFSGLVKECYKARKQSDVLAQSQGLDGWHQTLLAATTTPSGQVFMQLSTLLADAGHFSAAIAQCDSALALGLDDGTVTGFAGRKTRLQRAQQKANAQ
ncbi:hypothetical protein [Shewanella sp. NIFS-20-20]|uniref:hypothetical protein n=1 Tax=Shewanella sp. NIFS-20-20 TaxID=2853806 RepID=UPI001C45A8B4|nr:hypothetical protein [Shewanella sp. NIFS-20-20]MBV7315655.1 hypothetical protein [Shewanella sp. NIFS-20-20]